MNIFEKKNFFKYTLSFMLCFSFAILTLFGSCKKNDNHPNQQLSLLSVFVGSDSLSLIKGQANNDAPLFEAIEVTFSRPLDTNSAKSGISLISLSGVIPMQISFRSLDKIIFAIPPKLHVNQTYSLALAHTIKSADGHSFYGDTVSFSTKKVAFGIVSFKVAGTDLFTVQRTTNVDRNFPAVIKFNIPVDPSSLTSNTIIVNTYNSKASLTYTFSDSNKILSIQANPKLLHFQLYKITINNQLKSATGINFDGYKKNFYTAIDTTPKFPVISDDALLTLVEQQTFKYFWDFAHPVSGLARERNTSGDVVTIGGSGFGVMSIIVGIQRNFITRQQGVDRLLEMVNFLGKADRFHGAWPHWMDGYTGKTVPFSPEDDGGDLVETAYMIHGLLAARQFLNPAVAEEDSVISKITNLYDGVEWDWYTQGKNILYWHWSPDHAWEENFPVTGWNEAMITYFLAAGSPTHPVSKTVYTNGWAQNGAIKNGNSYYGFLLPLGEQLGGPLFFSHYSFLGLNPTNLQDQYANYWTQNLNHTLINRAYCIANPGKYVDYSSQCWGLTASDDPEGYDAHSPTNDDGTITPSAALSAIPYTPQYAMDAMKFFYYTLGDKLWGPYGFYDAFNTTSGWYASSTLAIDEGPIIDMIENYRTGLLWNLFMSAPEVTAAMNTLGFTN